MQLLLFLLLVQGVQLSQWQTGAFGLYRKEFVPEIQCNGYYICCTKSSYVQNENVITMRITTIECTEDVVFFFFIWISLSPFSQRGMSLLRSADVVP